MDWYNYFKNEVFPFLPSTMELEESSYKNGDFGDIHRIESSYKTLLVNIDFWSSNTLDISIIDTSLEENYVLLQKLYFPNDNIDEVKKSLNDLLKIIKYHELK